MIAMRFLVKKIGIDRARQSEGCFLNVVQEDGGLEQKKEFDEVRCAAII